MADQVFTHSNVQFFISQNPQNADMSLLDFSGINLWVEVGAVGSLPERGINTNMLSYDTVNTLVAKKAKGITDAGTGTLECARNGGDPGQILMSQVGAPDYFDSHAFKLVKQDGTIEYGRGLVAGPAYPGGRNEDFDIANYIIAYQQAMVEDAAAMGATNYSIEVHSGVAYFQLVVDGQITGLLSPTSTDTDVADAIEAVSTLSVSGTTGDGSNATPWIGTLDNPALIVGIGANVTMS